MQTLAYAEPRNDMDSLLYLGNPDPRLAKLFSRLGYDYLVGDNQAKVKELTKKATLDLIIIDSSLDDGALDLCEFLKADPLTKELPIIYVSHAAEHKEAIGALKLKKLEVLESTASPGILVSKIATQLRLRKLAGAQDPTASIAEMNASLRDLTDRMKKEREEAKAIQQSLLPEALPTDDRYEVAVSYDPLDEVGGDWYYTRVHQSSKKVSAQIADVTGHGLAAAFIGSITKLALNAANEEDPGKLLTAMNRLMCPSMPPGRFVTMASLLFDPASGELQVARAGHPAPYVCRPTAPETAKKVEKVGSEGFAVGFLEDSEFKSTATTLAPGEFVLLVTDGITESQNRAGEMYGARRLVEFLSALDTKQSAAEMLRAILEDFERFCDGRLIKDDVTVILLKRR